MVTADPSQIVAVLTGDLVNSTRMTSDQHEGVRTVLTEAARRARRWSKSAMRGPDFYRGDAWQMVLEDPRYFLRLAVWLQAHLAAREDGAETRIAIGLGTAEVIHSRAVSRSIGEAFTLSGRALDDMGRRRGLVLALPEASDALPWMSAQVTACEFIVSGWTRSQAEVALLFLAPNAPSQLEAAKALNKHSQAVSRVYRDAGVYALLDLLQTVEAAPFEALGVKGRAGKGSPS